MMVLIGLAIKTLVMNSEMNWTEMHSLISKNIESNWIKILQPQERGALTYCQTGTIDTPSMVLLYI